MLCYALRLYLHFLAQHIVGALYLLDNVSDSLTTPSFLLPSYILYNVSFFSFFLFFFFLQHPWHEEIPGPGIKPKPQLLPRPWQ